MGVVEKFVEKVKHFGIQELERQVDQELMEIYGLYSQFQEKMEKEKESKSEFLNHFDFLYFHYRIGLKLQRVCMKKIMLHPDEAYRSKKVKEIEAMLNIFRTPLDQHFEDMPIIISTFVEKKT